MWLKVAVIMCIRTLLTLLGASVPVAVAPSIGYVDGGRLFRQL